MSCNSKKRTKNAAATLASFTGYGLGAWLLAAGSVLPAYATPAEEASPERASALTPSASSPTNTAPANSKPLVESAVQELEPVVVYAEWLGPATKASERRYAGARTVIEADTLHERGALNLEDALRSTPGLQVLDETGTGILPNIGVRGLNPLRSERLQMLVDGYPIAIGPYSNVGVSLFPVTLPSLEAVDVVRGGAAVHYGPNNVGGILNLVTRPIPRTTTQTLRQRLTLAEGTENLLSDSYYRIGGQATEDLGLQLQANVVRGDGAREHSDTEVNNLILDGRYTLNDRNELATQLQYYDVKAELPGALSPKAYVQDRTQSQRPHDAFEADMWRATLTWTFLPSDNVEFEWRNFAHDADRTFWFGQAGASFSMDPALTATHVSDSPRAFQVFGTEPRLTLRQGMHTAILGARYVEEDVAFDVNRTALATGLRTVVRDWALDTKAVALYASDTLSLLDKRLSITPGLRYEDVRMDFTDNKNGAAEDNHAEALLPGLTVGYQATEQLFLFTNAQRSLVPVQIAQAVKKTDVANEKAWNYEVGARVQTLPSLLNSVTLFRIDYEDQIQFNKTADRFENLGETRHEGIELDNHWQATDSLGLRLAYTYLETEQRSVPNQGKHLPNAPRHHVSLETSYRYQQWQAGLIGTYVAKSFSDAANTRKETANGSAGELPSYTLVNLSVGRDFALGEARKLNLGLAVNNATNEDYYFRGVDVSPIGRVPGPGRSYALTGQLDF